MTRAQRIIVLIYCLLVVYCGVWVPWHYSSARIKDVKEGYALIWNGPPDGYGTPDVAAVTSRVLAATGLCAAAFLLSAKWKALLSVAILCGAGILLYGYWTDRVAERRTQKIHDCAVARVATAKCSPPNTQGDTVGQVAASPPNKNRFEVLEVCDPYVLSDNPTAQEEDSAIAAAEKECATEIQPKKKSAHEEIEEYKLQHGIKQ